MLYPANTAPIPFSLRRATSQYSYTSCCALVLSQAQTMVIQATLTNYMLQSTSNYIITFIPTYFGIYYFVVNFGSAYSFTVSTVYSCYISTLTISSQMVCTAISSYQIKVTLTNPLTAFTSIFGYASNYSLVIIGIANPSQVSNTIQLSSYYLPSTQLEYSNIYTITFNTALMLDASISCSSYQVGATSSYTFSINNTNSLLPNSILNIYFPYSYTLTGSQTCTTNGVTSSCPNVNATYLQFILPGSAIASYTLSATTLTVQNIVNPSSSEPTASFGLSLSSGGAVVQGIYDGVVVIMNTLAHFTSLSVVPSTLNVGSLASETINFAHTLVIPGSSVITLSFQLPSSLTFVSCSACTSFQTFTITSSTTSVVISSIYNPQKVTEASNIVISLYVDGYLSIQDSISSPTYTQLTTSWAINSNSSFLGQHSDVNITIQNLPLNTQFFVITIPAEYSIGTLSAFSEGSIAFTYVLTGYSLNCTVSFISSQNATIIIEGLTNPVVATSSFWQVNIFAASSILISQQTSSIKFNAVCGTTCRQCTTITNCISCYSNPLVNNLIYLSKSTNLCVASCSSTQYLQGSTCYNCLASCVTCSLFAANCTSCAPSTFLLLSNCVAQCPDTYYTSGTTWTSCTNNCQTCSSSIACITCVNGYVLQGDSTCQLTCTSGQYNSSNVCVTCPTNCLTCNPIGCLTCSGANYLTPFTSPTCVSACPTNTYISTNNLLCLACQSPCVTCSISATNCTSCSSASANKYLSNFKCLINCPSQTYPDELFQCNSCQSPCNDCSNYDVCLSCITPYVFYAATNECLVSCFSNTINISNTCVQCVSPCLTCSVTANNCTSCIENYFFLNNACSTTCTFPYIATNSICSLCYSPCATCVASNKTNCSSCITGYYLFAFTCYQNCPVQTYSNTATTCALCTPPCYKCSGTSLTCTACFTGSFLFSSTCYSPCPPTYYENNNTCELCQPQCTSCNHTTSYECSSCIPGYYFNPINYQCTNNCVSPYYIKFGQMICQPCQLPCKSCVVSSGACSSCYTGYFLLSQSCITTCGNGYYGDGASNTCIQCTNPCATCDNQKCFTCVLGAYFYDGGCYNVCPASAPNAFGLYCRNCLKDNCINCNAQGACTLCVPGTYNLNGNCLSVCPSDYEPDLVSSSQCILRSDIAYYNYIKKLQNKKIWLAPSSVLFAVSLPFLHFAEVKLFYFAFALGIPQILSLLELTANYVHDWSYFSIALFPEWLMYALVGLQAIGSLIYTLIIKTQFQKQQVFKKWIAYGSNKFRYTIVIIFSFINKQFLFILFSGLFSLPFTTFKFKISRSLIVCHSLYLVIEGAIFSIGMLIAYYENTLQYDNKLFYSAVDLLIIYGITFIFQVIFLLLLKNQPVTLEYKKYILPNVSNRSLPAFSELNDDIVDEKPNNLHRSNSDQDILESKEMKDVEFLSDIDPDDYFDLTPKMPLNQVEEGLEKGDFRKKNKKKRGQRRLGRMRLDIIDEEDEDEEQREDSKKKKKKKKSKNEDAGGLKNYLYWKKPKQKKISPDVTFKQNENQIMSRIREKQSQFDSITQNDIIFQEFNEEQSSDDNYNIQEESRRALHKPNYDNYFNLNYASKKHLGQQ